MTIEVIQKTREYLDYVERHINNVQKAWELIKEKCKNEDFDFLTNEIKHNLILNDVLWHDLSKLSENEFVQYRQYFFPTDFETKNKGKFLQAWEHHKTHNKHHWQSWTKHLENTNEHPMKEVYVVTMVIDWVAMGFEFGDTAKAYYEANKDDILLPDWAIKLMYKIFDCVYGGK